MDEITVKGVRSDELYRRILLSPPEKKDDIYRYDFMKLFEKKWACYPIPIKAKKPGGYDVVMASGMMGFLLPTQIDASRQKDIDAISDPALWLRCQDAVERSLRHFIDAGVPLTVSEYMYTLMLMNPESSYARLNDNFCGDGGIPGYILAGLVPNEHTLARLPVLLSHEVNHNVRYQFIRWTNDVTLGEYMIAEGLAENFATQMFGCDHVGPWVSKTDSETLNEWIKPFIKDALGEQGFSNITAWMFGDEMAELQDYIPVGMPYCAGYACGYYLVKYFLQKTGETIAQATVRPAGEILEAAADFWAATTETTEFGN